MVVDKKTNIVNVIYEYLMQQLEPRDRIQDAKISSESGMSRTLIS